jgi:mutator protein MutT
MGSTEATPGGRRGGRADRRRRPLPADQPPEGKVYAGYWEFPGGKLEAGETVEQALRRELHEELGITIGAVQPWQQEMFDYPHARVRLHFCKVYDWQGAFEMREAQQMAWQTLPVAGGAGAAGHHAGAALVCRRARLQRPHPLDCRPWTGSTASSGTATGWCP